MSKEKKKDLTPTQKAGKTAKWARIMTKWLITRSGKREGVKWQLVEFNGRKPKPAKGDSQEVAEAKKRKGQESRGIVDLMAIRKNHRKPEDGGHKGDLFEIVLVQVKGGSAKFPTKVDIARLLHVRKHHQATKVVLAEWKQDKKLCIYEWEHLDATWDPKSGTWNPKGADWKEVTAASIFGKLSNNSQALVQSKPNSLSLTVLLTPAQKASATKKANAKANI